MKSWGPVIARSVLLVAALLLAACARSHSGAESSLPPPPPPQPVELPDAIPSPDNPGGPPGPALDDEYPRFPWPPPKASATEVVPRRALTIQSPRTRLSDVDLRLTGALEANGYFESSYYSVPDGFALVTKMEQIRADGAPESEPGRWSLEVPRLNGFSLSAYLQALFTARPGRYRVIAFIVTPHPFRQSGVEVTAQEAAAWLSGGLDRLPAPLGAREFGPDHACTALIYEFIRLTESDEPKFLAPGALPGRIHLQKSGLWEALQR